MQNFFGQLTRISLEIIPRISYGISNNMYQDFHGNCHQKFLESPYQDFPRNSYKDALGIFSTKFPRNLLKFQNLLWEAYQEFVNDKFLQNQDGSRVSLELHEKFLEIPNKNFLKILTEVPLGFFHNSQKFTKIFLGSLQRKFFWQSLTRCLKSFTGIFSKSSMKSFPRFSWKGLQRCSWDFCFHFFQEYTKISKISLWSQPRFPWKYSQKFPLQSLTRCLKIFMGIFSKNSSEFLPRFRWKPLERCLRDFFF